MPKNLLVYETETLEEVRCLRMDEITSIQIRDDMVRIVTVHVEIMSFPLSKFSIITID